MAVPHVEQILRDRHRRSRVARAVDRVALHLIEARKLWRPHRLGHVVIGQSIKGSVDRLFRAPIQRVDLRMHLLPARKARLELGKAGAGVVGRGHGSTGRQRQRPQAAVPASAARRDRVLRDGLSEDTLRSAIVHASNVDGGQGVRRRLTGGDARPLLRGPSRCAPNRSVRQREKPGDGLL
jgi:hypothetical protein